MEERRIPGDGVVTGWGTVDGRQVFIFSHDASVFGGSLGEGVRGEGDQDHDLAQRTAMSCIGINDSGGARIQEGVVSLAGYAEIFYRNVESSGVIPQLSLIGRAMHRRRGLLTGDDRLHLHGPQRRLHVHHRPRCHQGATGEQVTFEELGGSDVHNQRSGVAHFIADTEDEAFPPDA